MKNNKMNFIQYLIKQVKNFYKLEIVSFFLTISFSISVIATPYLTRYLIDLFSRNKSLSDVWTVMLAFLMACFLQPVFSFFNIKIIKKISEEIILKIRCLLFNNVIKAPLSFYQKTSSGSIISRLVNDSNQFGQFLSSSITIVLQNVLFIILILIGMFLLSKIITLSLCALLSVYVIFNLLFNKKFEKRSENILKNNDDLYKIINQCIDRIEEIKTTQQERNFYNVFFTSAKNLYVNKLKFYNLSNVIESVNATLGALSILLIYVVGFYLISKGKLTIGSVVAFDIYFQMIVPSIKQLINFNSNYHEIIPVFSRLEDHFNIILEKQLISSSYLDNVPSVIFDNVTFKYDNNSKNKKVLNNFSFEFISPGLYGIIGKSGIGKSTIAKLIVGLYEPIRGNITIEFGKKTNSIVRDNIGYASQNMKLFYDTTIMYNLTLGNQDISDKQVYSICKKLNLHNKILKLLNGYEELITEKVNFSGGEIQRIILARIYLQKKSIVVLDEITSALDTVNTKIVKDVIDDLSKNSLVILLTHNLKLLNNAKQIIKL